MKRDDSSMAKKMGVPEKKMGVPENTLPDFGNT
jgi:hypothetical protein